MERSRWKAMRSGSNTVHTGSHTDVLRIGIADLFVGDRRRGAPAPRTGPKGGEAKASPEGIVFRDDHDLVPVDFIGGDGAIGSITGLEDDDRDHERGGEGGGEGVCIFAGH